MPGIPTDIQIGAALIDDYLYLEDAPVGPDPQGRFLAVQDPTDLSSRLLAVDSDGKLTHFYPDPTSHSGWNNETVSVTAPPNATAITRLSGYIQDGMLNALCYYAVSGVTSSGAVWMQSTGPGQWVEAPLTSSALNALAYTYQTDHFIDSAGNQYLYGVSAGIGEGAFYIVSYDPGQGQWDILFEQLTASTQFPTPISTGAAFRLTEADDGSINVLWVDGGLVYYWNATISDPGTEDAAFSWNGQASSFNPNLGALAVQSLIDVPGPQGVDNVLLLDSGGNLYWVQGYSSVSPSMTRLTGGAGQPKGVISATASIDGTGNLRIMCAESAVQSLWILRQSGAGPSGPAFASWTPLGNPVAAVSAPASAAGGPEVFLVSVSLDVYHLSQNLVDYTWLGRQIAAPAPSTAAPQNIACTRMDLDVVDDSGTNVPGALVTIGADAPAVVVVNDVAYPVGPGQPATVQADPVGQVSVLLQTTSLSTPDFTFTVTNGDGTTAARGCQGDAPQIKLGETPPPISPASIGPRVAGTDPTLPIGTSQLTTAGVLSPLCPDPSGAIQTLASLGSWIVFAQANISAAVITPPDTAIHLARDPISGQFRQMSADEVARMKEASIDGGVLGSISHFFGDVANFFKHAWKALEHIGVEIEQGVLHIFLNAEHWVVNTVREAKASIETLVSWMAQGLEDALDAFLNYIKRLFDWQNILNTHQVIKALVNSAMSEVGAGIEQLETLVKSVATTLSGDVTNAFANLEAMFQSGQSFNAVANAAGPTPISGSGANVLQPASASNVVTTDKSRLKYGHTYVSQYYARNGAPTLAGGSQSDLADAASSWSNGFQAQMQPFATYMNTAAPDVRQIFDTVMVDLLTALKDAIVWAIQGFEDFAIFVLQQIQDAIAGLQALLNFQPDIPVLSWLYSHVITGTLTDPGDPLTVLDALCLVAAIPCTIGYELVMGAPLFTAAEVASINQDGIPWPAWPASPAAGPAGRLGESGEEEPPPAWAKAVNTLGGVMVMAMGFVNAANDLCATGAQMPGGLGLMKGVAFALSLVGVIGGLATAPAVAPWPVLVKGADNWTTADKWTVYFWLGTLAPILVDGLSTWKWGSQVRYLTTVGPIIDTAFGLVLTGIGGAAAHFQLAEMPPYTRWDPANDILSQVGRVFRFLLLFGDMILTTGGLMALDVILGFGAGATQIGVAIEG